jgi:hypothetical protein
MYSCVLVKYVDKAARGVQAKRLEEAAHAVRRRSLEAIMSATKGVYGV